MRAARSPLFRRLPHQVDERLTLIICAAVVGVGAGLGSVLLNESLALGGSILHPFRGRWYGPLLPAAGALTAVIILKFLFHEVGGHGVPEVLYSISRKGGLLRLRASVSRLVACALTIASGGSAGPEAPVVISGASVGSNTANLFRMNERQRTAIVGCGASAAIAAIFNAPATGIVFALEAIIGEWTPINLVPIAIASVLGTEVSRAFHGNQIPFEHRVFEVSGLDLATCVGLVLFTAAAAVLFVRALRMSERLFSRLPANIYLRVALGGLAVGALGILLPEVLGEGYEVTREIIEGIHAPGVLLIGTMVLAKILATTLTLGSGGVGGVFAPCLVVGAFTGLFYQRGLTALFPRVGWAGEGYFGLLGMAGVTASVIQAPLTGIFLVMEITGGYDVLVSVVLVAVLSATLSHAFEPHSIYHEKLIARRQLLRPRTDARILSEITVAEVLERDVHVIPPDMRLGEFVEVVRQSHRNYFPVVDRGNGKFVGMVHLDDVRSYLFDPTLYDSVVVEEFMRRGVPAVSYEDELPDILLKFEETGSWSLPVLHRGVFLGLVSKSTLLDHYRRELLAQESD